MSHWKSFGLAIFVGVCLLGEATAAHAELQVSIGVNEPNVLAAQVLCVDNEACDANPETGTIQLDNFSVDGVEFNGSTLISTGTPANLGVDTLSSTMSIINTTGAAVGVVIAVGDTNFEHPTNRFNISWSVGPSPSGTSRSGDIIWFVDPSNGQGVPNFAGARIGDSLFAETGSFQAESLRVFPVSAPFSMTEGSVSIVLGGHAEMPDFHMEMSEAAGAIPETSTWAMMLLGFAGLGFVAYCQTGRASFRQR
jgi:hypothetical protein